MAWARDVAILRLIIGAFVLLAAKEVWAQARSLTLRDAVALAVRGNAGLGVARVDVAIADAGVVAAEGMDDFVLEAGAEWLRARMEPVPGTPVQQPAVDEIAGRLALVKPIATGGRLSLGVFGEWGRREFATDVAAMMAGRTVEEYAPSLRLGLVHPLLRGLGPSVARAPQRRAAVAVDAARAAREATAAVVVRDVVLGYWDLVYAKEQLVIRQAAAASAREQLERVKATIDVGKLPRSASAEIDVAIAFRDEQALLAAQGMVDRALELLRTCGLPQSLAAARALAATDAPVPPARKVSEAEARETALARNPELVRLRADERAATIEVEVTDNGLLPQLDLAVSGGPTGNAGEAGVAWRQVKSLGTYTVNASLVFSQPLGRHAARGAHEAARQTRHKVLLSRDDISQQITTAIARGLMAVETARGRSEVLAKSVDAAALDLEAEKARFEVGRASNFDVLRRQESLTSVQLGYLRARVDHLRALAVLDALTGEILARNGVSL